MLGPDPITTAAINGLTALITSLIKEKGAKALEGLDKNIANPQTLRRSTKNYVHQYTNRHGILQVLGMSKPVPLDQIYRKVQVLDRSTLLRFASPETLEKEYRKSNNRSLASGSRIQQHGMTVANTEQYLMVLGGPGIGKSTFLRKVGLEALKGYQQGEYKHSRIPVFIELKRFTVGSIETLIEKELEILGYPSLLLERFLHIALTKGKFLFLLDGLDEVPTEHLNYSIDEIRDFVHRYDKNRFIISCRTAAYQNFFPGFVNVAISNFDDAQIKQFIGSWFQSELDLQTNTAQKCWSLLQKKENSSIKELAQTPLLLTFLCLVYHRTQHLPSHRSDLYSKALDILLEEWSAEKRVDYKDIYPMFHTSLEKALLAEIAWENFKENKLFFQEAEVVSQIVDFLQDTLDAPNSLDGRRILKEIETQHGIIVERAESIYSFSHLTLQEYLTAKYIDQHRLIHQVVDVHLTEPRWREIFVLTAEIKKGGVNRFLAHLEERSRKYLHTKKLKQLIAWARTSTMHGHNYSYSAKRAIAIAVIIVVISAVDRARVGASDSVNRSQDVAPANAIYIANALDPEVDTEALRREIIHIRTIAIDIAINTARSGNSDSEIMNACYQTRANAIKLLQIAEKMKIFDSRVIEESMKNLQAFRTSCQPRNVQAIYLTLLKGIQLAHDQVQLSTDEKNALDRYLAAHKLIIDCRDSGIAVSRRNWSDIESRFLNII